ncbi:hypothetical protein JW710_02650 [Candidatus Dojkabacteria bacterium]|nr:hypothetical protein [Candidatus Dojkabacteria bacterium]
MSAGMSDDVQYEGTKVGEVTHFFDKISVAAVNPTAVIKVGDTIKVYDKEGNVVLEQQIESMQVSNQSVEEVQPGEEFGMKVEGEVKEGYQVYKV